MAEMFRLTFNIEAAIKQMGVVMTSRIPVAIARGINRTANSERSVMGSAVAKNMGIPVARAKAGIRVEKATANRLVARVSVTGARIPRIDFAARGPYPSRGKGRGVSYRGEDGKRITVPDAFIAIVGAGHRGVFRRKTSKRLPIRELFGPSIAYVFGKLIPLAEARRTEVLVKNVSHEIEFALSRGA